MRLQTKFTLSVAAVLTPVMIVAAWSWATIQRGRLEADAFQSLDVMQSTLDATRSYTHDVLGAAVAKNNGDPINPTAAVRDVFHRFAKDHPAYLLREASDNPLDESDRADPLERGLLDQFRRDRNLRSLNTFVTDSRGTEWAVAAKPVIADESCLQCHGQADRAATSQVERFGSTHGYGWKAGDVVGVQTARYNTAELRTAQAMLSQRAFIWGAELALAALIVVKLAARRFVSDPIERLGHRMRRVAAGETDQPLTENRNDELGTCVLAFNGMLDTVQRGIKRLKSANENLEQHVEQRTRELAQRTADLESANRAKSEFLAAMSHEIRTPLNGVIGTLELLKGSRLDAAQLRYIDMAHGSSQTLLAVINDILDFSKIEAGKLDLERAEFNVRDVVRGVAHLLAPLAAKKGVAVAFGVSPSLANRLVLGDAVRVRQIITNLLGNAIKFTSAGKVTIQAVTVRAKSDPRSTLVKISVNDTGIGITADRIDRLFKSFSQVDSTTTRRFGGSGLGLAICKRLAEAMGGEIGVESIEGKGSTFWFTVQLDAVESPSSTPATSGPRPIEPQLRRRPLRVLLAEDNEVNQLVATEILRRAGHSIDIAFNGRLALQAFRLKTYDLVLMDCQMPEMDGFEAARAIREYEALQRGVNSDAPAPVPIVALTASAVKGDKERCIEAGMNDYVAKPFAPRQLLALMEKLTASSAPNALPPLAAATPRDASEQSFDYAALLDRCLGDTAFLGRMLSRFPEVIGSNLEQLERSVAAVDVKETARVAHSLKGTAACLSATHVQRLASELEDLSSRGSIDGAVDRLEALREEVARCVRQIPAFLPPKTNAPRKSSSVFSG